LKPVINICFCCSPEEIWEDEEDQDDMYLMVDPPPSQPMGFQLVDESSSLQPMGIKYSPVNRRPVKPFAATKKAAARKERDELERAFVSGPRL
jgi:hypothetical protein